MSDARTIVDRFAQSAGDLARDCLCFLEMAHGVVEHSLQRIDNSALYGVRDLLQMRLENVSTTVRAKDFDGLEVESSKIDSAQAMLSMIAESEDDKALWGALELLDQSKAFLDKAVGKHSEAVSV